MSFFPFLYVVVIFLLTRERERERERERDSPFAHFLKMHVHTRSTKNIRFAYEMDAGNHLLFLFSPGVHIVIIVPYPSSDGKL